MFSEINSFIYDLPYQDPSKVKSYIIASTPRSGSTLLGKLLSETKIAGSPHEFFHDKHSKDYFARWKINSLEEYIAYLYSNRSTQNGIFGIKIHYHQLKNFDIKTVELNKIFNCPKYIFIRRKNKLEQAISLAKALQTKQWAVQDGEDVKKAVYDYHQIKRCLTNLENEEKKWEELFIENRINYFELYYEDFISDINFYIIQVLDFLNIQCINLPILKPSIKQMKNNESNEWYKRFLHEQ